MAWLSVDIEVDFVVWVVEIDLISVWIIIDLILCKDQSWLGFVWGAK